MEMAAAEAVADTLGEPILHVDDKVRLEGLVKNKNLNGCIGTLQSYGADSQRWKVVMPNSEVYWVKPKLVRPLETRRLPLPEAGVGGASGPAEEAFAKRDEEQATALAAGWAVLEAQQERLRAELEAREILLLEREESLRKVQEALEVEQLQLGETRHSMAVEQARGLAEIDRHFSTAKRSSGAGLEPTSFSLDDGLDEDQSPDDKDELELISTAEGSVRTMGEEEAEDEEEADEVWDMDWSSLGGGGGGPPQPLLAPGGGAQPLDLHKEPALVSSEPEHRGGAETGQSCPL